MGLEEIVNINITSATAGVAQAGFGKPGILSHSSALGLDRARDYASLRAVSDDYASSTPEYKAATKIFSQSPRPRRVSVLRADGAVPTQKHSISVASVKNSTKYQFNANGTLVEFTSDSSATNDEIVTGLQTAFDALAISGFTSSLQGTSGSKTLQILADAAGGFLSVEVLDLRLLASAQTHADPGVAAELDIIKTVDNSWYALTTLFNSSAYIAAVAGWVEANDKLYIAQTGDSAVATVSNGSDTTSIAHTLKVAAYARTALFFHPAGDAFADAAWLGKCLPMEPGSETWKFKTLNSVPAVALTDAQITNLKTKYVNFYRTLGGVNITGEGVVSANEYIDVIRFRDWLVARMGERIFGALVNNKKIAFTDKGIAMIAGEVRAQLSDGIKVGGLAEDPKPVVTVPKAADVSANDKADRHLPDVEFSATLAGAIHDLEINGTISN